MSGERRLSAKQLARALRRAAKRLPPSEGLAAAALREAATQIVAHLGDSGDKHEKELSRLASTLSIVHPLGRVKHIGIMEAVDAAIGLLGAADGDGEQVSSSWLWSVGFYRDEDYGGDPGWFSRELGDSTGDWVSVNPTEGAVMIFNDNKRDCPSVRRPIKTRGQLRRLWFALTGEELATWNG